MTEFSNRSLVALALLPLIFVELCFLPMWCVHGFMENHIGLVELHMAFSVILLPFYLAAFGIWRILRGDRWIIAVFVTLVAVLPLGLEYAMWGISSGQFWSPDFETRDVMTGFAWFAVCFAAFPMLLTVACRTVVRLLVKPAAG